MKIIDRIALILVIIGALNWGSVGFFAFESTGMSASEQAEQFDDFNSVPPVGVKLPYGPPLPTKLRVGVCHKTVEGLEYCLVVVVRA